MTSLLLVASIHVVLLAGIADRNQRVRVDAALSLDVTPIVLMADHDVRAIVRVRPSQANRLLTIALDGEYFSSTERNLDGERAARTYEFYFRKLPAGEYVVTAEVADSIGRVHATERHVTVIGPTEGGGPTGQRQ